MKDKIIYWLKVIRNIFDSTIILILLYAFVRTLIGFELKAADGGIFSGSWDSWFTNLVIYFKRVIPREVDIMKYNAWQYYFEIILFSLPTLFFIGLELYKRRLFIFKKVDNLKESHKQNNINKLENKLENLKSK